MKTMVTQNQPWVLENNGRAAVTRGPLVYCAEEIDNPGYDQERFHVEASLPVRTEAIIEELDAGKPGIALRIGSRLLVPYYYWNNRGAGAMAVWLKQQTGPAETRKTVENTG